MSLGDLVWILAPKNKPIHSNYEPVPLELPLYVPYEELGEPPNEEKEDPRVIIIDYGGKEESNDDKEKDKHCYTISMI